MRICVDCDRIIAGAYGVAAHGDSMSGARPDSYAHPPRSPECRPRSPGKGRLPEVVLMKFLFRC
ncbi:hypothetical protein ABID95_007424 [Streptomyces atratus]